MTPPVSAPRAYDKKIRLLSGHNVDKDSVVVETIGVGEIAARPSLVTLASHKRCGERQNN